MNSQMTTGTYPTTPLPLGEAKQPTFTSTSSPAGDNYTDNHDLEETAEQQSALDGIATPAGDDRTDDYAPDESVDQQSDLERVAELTGHGCIAELTSGEIALVINKKVKDNSNNYLFIGNLLNEAKKKVKHGEWKDWIDNNVDITQHEAARYMRAAKTFQNNTSISNLGVTKAYALSKIPEEELEGFIDSFHNVNGAPKTVKEMSVSELKEVVNEYMDKRSQEADDSSNATESKPKKVESILSVIKSTKKQIEKLTACLKGDADCKGAADDYPNDLRSISVAMADCKEQISLIVI